MRIKLASDWFAETNSLFPKANLYEISNIITKK